MSQAFARILCIALLSTLCWSPDARADICRRQTHGGYSDQHYRAANVLPKDTRNPLEISIYIERDPKDQDKFYFHSNFISEGAVFSTKIADLPTPDIETLVAHIVWPPEKVAAEWSRFGAEILPKTRLIVDSKSFDSSGKLGLDLSGIERILVVERGQKTSREARRLMAGGAERDAVWINRIAGCCVYAQASVPADTLVKRLGQIPIDADEMRMVSFVVDGATEQVLKQPNLARITRQFDLHDAGDVLTRLDTEFQQMRGKTVLLFGHIEDGSFVTRVSDEVLLRVPLEQTRQLARKYDITLIELGCDSAHQISKRYDDLSKDDIAAISGKFNTVVMARRLESALNEATSFSTFLERISDAQVELVIGQEFLSGRSLVGEFIVSEREIGQLRVYINSSTLARTAKLREPGENPRYENAECDTKKWHPDFLELIRSDFNKGLGHWQAREFFACIGKQDRERREREKQ